MIVVCCLVSDVYLDLVYYTTIVVGCWLFVVCSLLLVVCCLLLCVCCLVSLVYCCVPCFVALGCDLFEDRLFFSFSLVVVLGLLIWWLLMVVVASVLFLVYSVPCGVWFRFVCFVLCVLLLFGWLFVVVLVFLVCVLLLCV